MSVLRGQVRSLLVLNYFQFIFVFISTVPPPFFFFICDCMQVRWIGSAFEVHVLYGKYEVQQIANRLPASAEKRVWRAKQAGQAERMQILFLMRQSVFFYIFSWSKKRTARERQKHKRHEPYMQEKCRPVNPGPFTKICQKFISKQSTISNLTIQIMVPDSDIMERRHQQNVYRLPHPTLVPRLQF